MVGTTRPPLASRRDLLRLAGNAAIVPVAASLVQDRVSAATTMQSTTDLQRYVAFGNKASGGPGDEATGNWLASEMEKLGFTVARQPIAVPYFDTELAELQTGSAKAATLPQAVVIPTDRAGIRGHLVRLSAATVGIADARAAIALVDLPFARWSTIEIIRPLIMSLFVRGAKAVVLVTNGPTGKAIALNVDSAAPSFGGPVVVLASDAAAPFLVAAESRQDAVLRLRGVSGQRPAFNLVARRPGMRRGWIAVSTPRSGWFTCAGERAPGVAVWLELARWAIKNADDTNLAFFCTSGHEYENLGMAQILDQMAPPRDDTAIWLHLGANVAARDWRDLKPPLTPLNSPDPQRYLAVSPALREIAAQVFAGIPGLETPISTADGVEGELKALAARYPNVAGIFGAHRFHHVAEDDERCLLPEAIPAVVRAAKELILQARQPQRRAPQPPRPVRDRQPK